LSILVLHHHHYNVLCFPILVYVEGHTVSRHLFVVKRSSPALREFFWRTVLAHTK
jgi:hypothetical protein